MKLTFERETDMKCETRQRLAPKNDTEISSELPVAPQHCHVRFFKKPSQKNVSTHDETWEIGGPRLSEGTTATIGSL